MSAYSEIDFCQSDDGLDYIFGYMGAIYGAAFNRHWEGMNLELVRQVWKLKLGGFLTYKPSLDYALNKMDANFPPSAIRFRELCNLGPLIPSKPVIQIERQKTQAEIEEGERKKAEAIEKLKELRKAYAS